MLTSLLSRSIRRPLLAGLALLAGATTACSDTPTVTAPAAGPQASIVNVTLVATVSDTTVQTFTVSPWASETYVLGGVHKVAIAAGSVCDPLLSSYGATEWEKACVTIKAPLVFTAKSWTDAKGHPQVTFSPDVRFAPGKVNTLTLKDRNSAAALVNARIVWCATGATTCIDEAATDPTVATRLETNGMLSRRVKHFSGYTVIAD